MTELQHYQYQHYRSPLGVLLLATDGEALTGAWFEGQKHHPATRAWRSVEGHPLLTDAVAQLDAYFHGGAPGFDLRLAPAGTAFQQSVWRALREIPAGQTISYGELARRLDRPTAVRAVAAAVGRNPCSVIIPCHRVVGADGSLTGYAGGVERKARLLALEREGTGAAARRG